MTDPKALPDKTPLCPPTAKKTNFLVKARKSNAEALVFLSLNPKFHTDQNLTQFLIAFAQKRLPNLHYLLSIRKPRHLKLKTVKVIKNLSISLYSSRWLPYQTKRLKNYYPLSLKVQLTQSWASDSRHSILNRKILVSDRRSTNSNLQLIRNKSGKRKLFMRKLLN
jgi:hypothetical protein